MAIDLALHGKWQEAAQINKQILEDFPKDVDAYNRLGKAQTELGRYREAKQAYTKALEADPLNTIAQKNLARLATLKKASAPPRPGTQKISPQMFIEETGKTGVTTLVRPDMEIAAGMTAGDMVIIDVKKTKLVIKSIDGEQLGEVEPRLGQRLVKLIDAGNEYIAAISTLDETNVKVFIRETFQNSSQTGKLSFPPTITESFRPYVKERMVRNDADDGDFTDDGDEPDEWAGSSASEPDDADEDTGMIDLGRRGNAPAIDLDDENEE
ncbi:MAG: tetratricopeptide repeat protein [Chloroflexota bacterium]